MLLDPRADDRHAPHARHREGSLGLGLYIAREIARRCGRPAREISGDIYDLSEHNDEHATMAFGDVSGKGAAAALYGALISGLLRILAPRTQP